MLHATLRSLLAHKLRLALTAISVVLGVAFVAGTFMLTDTLNKSFTTLFDDINANTAVGVRAKAIVDSDGNTGDASRGTVPAAILDQVKAVPGVAEAQGGVSGYAQLIAPDGKVIKTTGAPMLGVSWSPSNALSSLHLAEGVAPTAAGEIAIDKATADGHGLKVGDTVKVLLKGPTQTERITGIFTFGDSGSLLGATLTAFDLTSAQQLVGTPGAFSDIAIAADSGVSQTVLAERVRAVLPDGYEALTGKQLAKEGADSIKGALTFITTFLLVFAGIALFVGSFIIVNTFSMLVAQRTRELALLRALGASRRQVTRSVLGEAIAVGVVAATVGLGIGVGVAYGLIALMSAIGLDLGTTHLVFLPRTAVVAYVVGIVVTVFAAMGPARRAAKVPPVAALRDDVAMPEKSLRRRALLGGIAAVAGAVLMVAGLGGASGSPAALVGLGAVGVFLGVASLSPLLSRPVIKVLAAPFPRWFGASGKLSGENARRNPRRTASTSAALMIGLALVSTMTVIGASAKASVVKIIDKSVGADYIVQSSSHSSFSPEVAKALDASAAVGDLASLRLGQAKINGSGATISGWTASTADTMLNLSMVSGSSKTLTQGDLLVMKKTATSKGWHVGDTVAATFPRTGAVSMTIGGIYDDNQLSGSYIVSTDVFEKNFNVDQQFDQVVLFNGAPGASAATVKDATDAVAEQYPNVEMQSQTEFKAQQKDQIDQLLGFIYVLLALAVLIAVLGIINTLALSVFERTREIGLLRAIGMSRRQLRRMVRLESVVIAVFGALLGVGLGVLFGWAMIRAAADAGLSELSIPAGQLIGYVVAAGVIGVLAALWPARRAAKLDVLKAIATN